jgi:hypothetical protein
MRRAVGLGAPEFSGEARRGLLKVRVCAFAGEKICNVLAQSFVVHVFFSGYDARKGFGCGEDGPAIQVEVDFASGKF